MSNEVNMTSSVSMSTCTRPHLANELQASSMARRQRGWSVLGGAWRRRSARQSLA